jgi:RecA-family ATPase
MFTQNMLLCLSAGIPFLGFRIPKPRRVLYVQSEVSEHAMQDRLKRTIAGHPDLNFADALLVNAQFRTIQYLVERGQPEILAFDPLYKLHTKDENKPHEMREIIDLF